jgi:hypothetical protein
VLDTLDSENAPSTLINTHLAFGDAQTSVMLAPANAPDKAEAPLHRTEMSHLRAAIPPIHAITGW